MANSTPTWSGSLAREGCDLHNAELFDARSFKEAVTKHEFAMTAKKVWGKGKATTLTSKGDLSRDEMMDPEGLSSSR